MVIHCDNQSAIQVVHNLVAQSKMKHAEHHFHYSIHLVQENIITLVYCKIDDDIVDNFTKPFSEANFVKIHNMIGL
jgi:hypothetical protein